MNYDDEMLAWVERLYGFPPARVRDGLDRVAHWGISHVRAELLDRATVENALAATLLAESVEHLTSLGIRESRLLKKLQDDRELWSTYAELRAAKLLTANFGTEAAFELEPARASGKHADFRMRVPFEDDPVFVEFQSDRVF